MIGFMLRRIAAGAAVGTFLLLALVASGGDAALALLAEALERPGQLAALWFGAVAPFAVGFFGTALALGDDGGSARRGPRRHLARPDRD